MKKKLKINIEVELDAQEMPLKINWTAKDKNGNPKREDAKAMLLAFYDREEKQTMKIDLWTKDLAIGEMNQLLFETFRSMTNTYLKATNNKDLANEMQKFAHYFGEKSGLLKKQ